MLTNQRVGVALNERYLALDVLRGLTIALMIVVNTPGNWSDIFSPFKHADWHGFTITDLVFPTFLFVVGNAMSFSMKKLERMDQGPFLKKVLKRFVLIFIIGWGLNAFPFVAPGDDGSMYMIDWTAVRTLGVLQRIALCYLFASLILFYFGKIGAILYSILALFGYWLIMYTFGDAEAPYSLTGNAALKLDLWVIGPKNLYGGEGIPFDPEGLLSTIPSVVNVLAGFFVGRFIQKMGNNTRTVKYLIIAGLIIIAVSLGWHTLFPINKKIWTSSYVLLTVGLDMLLIGLLIVIIEVARARSWTYFFEVFGRNPLILYVLSGVVMTIFYAINIQGDNLKVIIYTNAFTNWLPPKTASLLFSIAYMLLIWCIGLWMDKKKIYIKV